MQDEGFMHVLIYVEDMLVAASNKEEINKMNYQLRLQFQMKDIRDVKKNLRMNITREMPN